jgi:hypothetical protein
MAQALWPRSSAASYAGTNPVPPHVSQFLERSRPAADVPSRRGPGPRRSRCIRDKASWGFHVSACVRLTRAVPLHHQRPALAKHRVLAKGEGRDARAIFGSALTEEVERLAIARGPVQRGDSVVHLSRHHPAIHPCQRIQPPGHEEDFARTGPVYNDGCEDYPGGYPLHAAASAPLPVPRSTRESLCDLIFALY